LRSLDSSDDDPLALTPGPARCWSLRLCHAERVRRAPLHVGCLLSLGLALIPTGAHADPSFGAHDVRTVFHIAKSDDRNRVDYGIHLDAQCRPIGEAPIYAYWHRFEPGAPRYGDLNLFDRQVYAITWQSVRTRDPNGTWTEMRVAALPNLRILVLTQRTATGCIARARIPVNSRPAYVDRVFVQLANPFTIEHVTFRGLDVETSAPVSERRAR